MTFLIAALGGIAAVCAAYGRYRAAVAFAVWFVALLSIPARDAYFGGNIYVWPFLLAACALAAPFAPIAALIIGFGVGIAQIAEVKLSDPEAIQFLMYSVLCWLSLGLRAKVVSATCGAVSLFYVLAWSGAMDWRLAMICSEIVLVAGLCASVIGSGLGRGGRKRMDSHSGRGRPIRDMGGVSGAEGCVARSAPHDLPGA